MESLTKLPLENPEENSSATEVKETKSKKKLRPKKLDMLEWPYEISVDLHSSPKPKIAFLSGEERKYYPENPGHSKLAQVFVSNSHKGDTPNPSYVSPPIGVNKPISKIGYGIDHLLSKRFTEGKSSLEKRPDPGIYQRISRYPSRPKLFDIGNVVLRKQCKVSFGSSLTVPRFGVKLRIPPPGPGSYEASKCTGCPRIKHKASFGSRTCLIPTVVSVCTVSSGEICDDCQEELLYDYYRTKTPVIHHGGHPHWIALCRKCYCKAVNESPSAQWTKKEALLLFHKARNCSCMHEHNGIPAFLTTAQEHNIKKLSQKEAVLAKYFRDFCPPEIK